MTERQPDDDFDLIDEDLEPDAGDRTPPHGDLLDEIEDDSDDDDDE